MKIDKVTITGADDSTDISWMCEISEKYPFVEWGILVSEAQEGSPRFPSSDWLYELSKIRKSDKGFFDMNLSVHVCGKWVRDICKGDWTGIIFGYPLLVATHAQRIQLNFHSYFHSIAYNFFSSLKIVTTAGGHQIIFQIDGVNEGLVEKARQFGIDAVPLYDLSGGKGEVPDLWPTKKEGIYSGYAGGLGPKNILDEISRIMNSATGEGNIWIDMETQIRTSDDLKLNCGAVEEVLDKISNNYKL